MQSLRDRFEKAATDQNFVHRGRGYLEGGPHGFPGKLVRRKSGAERRNSRHQSLPAGASTSSSSSQAKEGHGVKRPPKWTEGYSRRDFQSWIVNRSSIVDAKHLKPRVEHIRCLSSSSCEHIAGKETSHRVDGALYRFLAHGPGFDQKRVAHMEKQKAAGKGDYDTIFRIMYCDSIHTLPA